MQNSRPRGFDFQAKLEYDKTLNSTPVNSKARIGPEGIKVAPRSAFKRELLSNHLLRDRFGLRTLNTNYDRSI